MRIRRVLGMNCCIECVTEADCGSGETCNGGSCEVASGGCQSDADCPAGLTRQTDGSCSSTCSSLASCLESACASECGRSTPTRAHGRMTAAGPTEKP